jgi:hypothetical protein
VLTPEDVRDVYSVRPASSRAMNAMYSAANLVRGYSSVAAGELVARTERTGAVVVCSKPGSFKLMFRRHADYVDSIDSREGPPGGNDRVD